ncbi:hypothetical protein IFR05_016529 [Cadophora sp. M221]|nr:hypothetical protein IFR05_016529 [Cadophora sp. M221]
MDGKENSPSFGEDIEGQNSKRSWIDEYDNGFREAPQSTGPYLVMLLPTQLQNQRGFGVRQLSGSFISLEQSRNSSMAGLLPNRESAATSISSFSPVNSAKARDLNTNASINLNRDKAARLHRINIIDRRIDEVTNEENTLKEDREKEIIEAARQIKERYRGRNEYIKTQYQSREAELEGLGRNGLDLKKRRAALEHF